VRTDEMSAGELETLSDRATLSDDVEISCPQPTQSLHAQIEWP